MWEISSFTYKSCPEEDIRSVEVCSHAAASGHLEMLKWARAQDPPCPWDVTTSRNAARYGHVEVLVWARVQDPPCAWDVTTSKYGAISQDHYTFAYLAVPGLCPTDQWLMSSVERDSSIVERVPSVLLAWFLRHSYTRVFRMR